MARPDTTQLRSLLEPARSIAVLLPEHPSYDSVASALSLKLSLENAGKTVVVACASPMTVEFNRLVGVNTVLSTLGSRNLIISFPGQTESVDKVSYNIEQGELQLVITPKANVPDLDVRKLKFTTGVGQMDAAIMVGVGDTRELGALFTSAKEVLANTKLVSLTQGLPFQNYTPTQLYDTDASSISEITAHVIDSMGLPLTADSASNLLDGMEQATANFRHQVSSGTFETAALLMRRGARRQDVYQPENLPPGSVPDAPYSSNQSGYGTDSAPVQDEAQAEIKPQEPSPDWFEPKVYQGSMLP